MNTGTHTRTATFTVRCANTRLGWRRMHNSGMRVSSIRQRTTHDSYAYVPYGCYAAYHLSSSSSVSRSRSLYASASICLSPFLTLSLFPFLPPRSNALHWFFGCWPTPTPSKNLLYCTLPALEAVSEDLDLFVREVCPLLLPKDLREVIEYREDKLHLRVDVSKRVERCWNIWYSRGPGTKIIRKNCWRIIENARVAFNVPRGSLEIIGSCSMLFENQVFKSFAKSYRPYNTP